jgi:pyruvate dehydrogenase E2 component (dihydrolipoamide acetyltransferase)
VKIQVEGSVKLDDRRRTSVEGGIYDISDLSERDRERLLDHPLVTPLEVDATDSARELAEEHGIDLNGIDGSGEDGRVLKSDVEAALEDEE